MPQLSPYITYKTDEESQGYLEVCLLYTSDAADDAMNV